MPQQRAEALYNFNPTADVELEIKKGDVIVVRRMDVGEGWWEGELGGLRGLFPSSYVKLLPLAESPTHQEQQWVHAHSVDRPKTPLTPGASKKASMDTLLAPDTFSNEQFYSKERALEIFVKGHEDIRITTWVASVEVKLQRLMEGATKRKQVGPSWDCEPPSYDITVRHFQGDSHRSSGGGLKRWSTYVVETKQLLSSVTRKFKQFLWLYDKLAEVFPCISLPPLPVNQCAGVRDPDGVEARRRGLERFLSRVSSHPVLGSAKLFHTFLTAKDDKEWKIGRHHSSYKLPKSAKKMFGAQVYSAVKYPAYNVPLNQLASIEKFSKFSRLLELNVQAMESSYLHLSSCHADMLSSLNLLGRDIQRFTRGLQPTSAAKRRKLLTSQASLGLVNGSQSPSPFHVSLAGQRVAPGDHEGEESEEEEEGGGDWNWREDLRFMKMTRDLHDMAGSMRQLTELGLTHQETVQAKVVDILRDYSGIIHTLPVLVKLHDEAMELFNASKEKDSKKEAEVVRQHCETLNNILLSEFDHFSQKVVEDFEGMMESFLKEQANYHRQLAEEWDSLHRHYSKRLSSRRQSSAHHRGSSRASVESPGPSHPHAAKPKSGSFTTPLCSSQDSASSLPEAAVAAVPGGDKLHWKSSSPQDQPSATTTSTPDIDKSHYNDSFEESGGESPIPSADTAAPPTTDPVVPSYISVERKVEKNRNDVSESDIVDPEILKPVKKKSLPELPIKHRPPPAPAQGAGAPPRVGKSPPTTTSEAPGVDSKVVEHKKTGDGESQEYAACIPRSASNSVPKELQTILARNNSVPASPSNGVSTGAAAISDPDEPQYANSMVAMGGSMSTTTPTSSTSQGEEKLDISARYETAFPHHIVSVPQSQPPPKKDSPGPSSSTTTIPDHDYVNLDVAMSKKKPASQKPSVPKKSPTLVKKPMPIQRKRTETSVQEEKPKDAASGGEKGRVERPSEKLTSVEKGRGERPVQEGKSSDSHTTTPAVAESTKKLVRIPTPKKPLPPAKPPKLLTSEFSQTSLNSKTDHVAAPLVATTISGGDTSHVIGGTRKGEVAALPIPIATATSSSDRTRPLSSDLTELASLSSSFGDDPAQGQDDSREDELSASLDSVTSKPRSYTSSCADYRKVDRKQPIVPPSRTPVKTTPTSSSSSSVAAGGRPGQPHPPPIEHKLPPKRSDSSPPKPLPPKSKPPPSTSAESVSSTAGSPSTERSQVSTTSSGLGKATPPPKPPRLGVKAGGRTGGAENNAPKEREELMKKLSLRRLRIEEQINSSSVGHSKGVATPPTAHPTVDTTPTETSSTRGGVAKSEAAPTVLESVSEERNSIVSTSSSLSEVIVAYHTKKLEVGGGGSAESSFSSNGASVGVASSDGGSGMAPVSMPAETVLRRMAPSTTTGPGGEENLSKFGIIEDESGGSYVI